jgi:hypothetical protein
MYINHNNHILTVARSPRKESLRRIFHSQGIVSIWQICGEVKELLFFYQWNGSRHLVFWSLGTLTGLRDRARRLVA